MASNNKSSGLGANNSTDSSLSGRVKTWFFSTSMNDASSGGVGGGKMGNSSSSSSSSGMGAGGMGSGFSPNYNSQTRTDLRGMNVWMPQSL